MNSIKSIELISLGLQRREIWITNMRLTYHLPLRSLLDRNNAECLFDLCAFECIQLSIFPSTMHFDWQVELIRKWSVFSKKLFLSSQWTNENELKIALRYSFWSWIQKISQEVVDSMMMRLKSNENLKNRLLYSVNVFIVPRI